MRRTLKNEWTEIGASGIEEAEQVMDVPERIDEECNVSVAVIVGSPVVGSELWLKFEPR